MTRCLTLLALAASVKASENCTLCGFDAADPPDCVVPGQLGDGELIPWARASQECLDVFSIKDEAIDPDTLAQMFPSSDGSEGNVGAFTNWLRFTNNQVTDSLQASFPAYFVDVGGTMTFRDDLSCSGTSACWTAFRQYLEGPGAAEMAAAGRTLWARQKSSREKEQALVRIRLCSDGPEEVCEPLSTQVQDVKAANPDKFCSAFGLGPGSKTLPDCAGPAGGNGTDAATARPFSAYAAVGVVVVAAAVV